jgi:hypothetical protein
MQFAESEDQFGHPSERKEHRLGAFKSKRRNATERNAERPLRLGEAAVIAGLSREALPAETVMVVVAAIVVPAPVTVAIPVAVTVMIPVAMIAVPIAVMGHISAIAKTDHRPTDTYEGPASRDPIAVSVVASDPLISWSGARRHVCHRGAHIHAKLRGLGLRRSHSQSACYQRCTQHPYLHVQHISSIHPARLLIG